MGRFVRPCMGADLCASLGKLLITSILIVHLTDTNVVNLPSYGMAATPQSRARAVFGPFEVNLLTGELLKLGLKIRLPGQPFQILLVLLARPGELVTRTELSEELWGLDIVVDFDQSLNTAINKLRRALGDSAEKPRYIETVPGRGYRFIGALKPVSASDHSGSAVVDKSGSSADAVEMSLTPRRRIRLWRIMLPSAVVLLGVLAQGSCIRGGAQP